MKLKNNFLIICLSIIISCCLIQSEIFCPPISKKRTSLSRKKRSRTRKSRSKRSRSKRRRSRRRSKSKKRRSENALKNANSFAKTFNPKAVKIPADANIKELVAKSKGDFYILSGLGTSSNIVHYVDGKIIGKISTRDTGAINSIDLTQEGRLCVVNKKGDVFIRNNRVWKKIKPIENAKGLAAFKENIFYYLNKVPKTNTVTIRKLKKNRANKWIEEHLGNIPKEKSIVSMEVDTKGTLYLLDKEGKIWTFNAKRARNEKEGKKKLAELRKKLKKKPSKKRSKKSRRKSKRRTRSRRSRRK